MIMAVSDNGHMDYTIVVNSTTDNNGNYSVMADVTYKTGLYYYELTAVTDTISVPGVKAFASTTDKDILINGTAHIGQHLNFHIKNTIPFDNNDVLDSLVMVGDSSIYYNYYDIIASNLKGMNIDTIIPKFESYDNPIYIFKYSFTKNNLTILKYDTIHTNCYGTTNVDVLY